MNLLDTIVNSKRSALEAMGASAPGESLSPADLVKQVACAADSAPRSSNLFKSKLSSSGINIIGEIKPKSPVSGPLLDPARIDHIVSLYKEHCAAVSVLTDEQFFGGSFALLAEVVERTGLPVLCKDFIISEHQIRLAKEAGASAVLLIVKILEEGQLHALAESARQFGLEPVIEINNQAELEIVMHLDAEVVLINNRDLDTMQIDLETTARLTTRLRQEHPSADTLKIISASGISTRDDILRLAGHANNFLIGSALMKSDSPAKLLASFTDGTQMTSSPDAVLAGDRTASAQQGR